MHEFTTRLTSYVSPLLKHHYALTKSAINLSNNTGVHSIRNQGTSTSASLHNTLHTNHNTNSPFIRNLNTCKKSDLYEVLGLSRSCSQFDIRKAYKKLSKMYHPDHNPDGQELFQNITEAYQVLGDPDLRRIYDQQSILRPMYTSPEPKTTHSHEPTVEPNEPVKADIRYTMNCTLEDLYNGNSKKRFTVKRNIFCSDCTTNSRSSCKTCCGKNIVQQKRIMKVNINKGMKSGQSIIFPGDGDQYARNKFGDAVFTVKQQPHDRFSRVGDHLFTRYEMDTADTNSGFFNIRHLDGRVLRVQHKNTVAVKCVVNEGMPQYQNSTQRGHLYIALEKKDPSTKLDSITVPHTTFVDAQVIDVPHSELSALNIPASFLSK